MANYRILLERDKKILPLFSSKKRRTIKNATEYFLEKYGIYITSLFRCVEEIYLKDSYIDNKQFHLTLLNIIKFRMELRGRKGEKTKELIQSLDNFIEQYRNIPKPVGRPKEKFYLLSYCLSRLFQRDSRTNWNDVIISLYFLDYIIKGIFYNFPTEPDNLTLLERKCDNNYKKMKSELRNRIRDFKRKDKTGEIIKLDSFIKKIKKNAEIEFKEMEDNAKRKALLKESKLDTK